MEVTSSFIKSLIPLIILVAFISVLLVVWLFWVMSRREQRRKSEGAARQDPGPGSTPGMFGRLLSATSAPPPLVSAPAPGVSQRPAGDDAIEVFRVLRDLADGSLVVEIDGVRYARLAEITDAQVGRRFVANARALAHFAMLLKGPPPPAPRPQAHAPPVSSPAPVPSPPPPPARSQAGRAAAGSEAGEQPPGMINLADEIEELLQQRLLARPELAGRSIHVRPSFGGGVRIVVGDTSYASVDEVPDEDVREFIRATIREWNARQ